MSENTAPLFVFKKQLVVFLEKKCLGEYGDSYFSKSSLITRPAFRLNERPSRSPAKKNTKNLFVS